MACRISTGFENLPSAANAERQVCGHVAALEALWPALTECQVRIAAQHRHHAQGDVYRVSVDLEIAGARQPHLTTQSMHEDLLTAVNSAFATALKTLERAAGRVTRDQAPGIIGGHVVQVSQQDGTGVLATDAGDIIRFEKEQVDPHVLASLHVGDRAWWMWDAVGGAGRLACAAHGRSGAYDGIFRPSVPTALPHGDHGPS